MAVAQHRHAIGEFHDLVELVRHEDETRSLVAQLAHQAEQKVRFFARKDGGRLIHEDDTRVTADSLGNFHHLFFGDRQRADHRILVDMGAEEIENAARFRAHELAVEHAEPGHFAAEKQALGDG
ncbi:hypothetical protein D9M72_416760 [compost metagenome]